MNARTELREPAYIRTVAHANGRNAEPLDSSRVPPIRSTEQADFFIEGEFVEELGDVGVEEVGRHGCEGQEKASMGEYGK